MDHTVPDDGRTATVDERRSLASEYALAAATLLTVLVVAGVAALTAHHLLGQGCESLAQSASATVPAVCR
ncbi:MAG TPA: hypothetical protein VMI11_12190 [Actinomycetes bacterium]|nr:hypothetical protein [Actinomycetes bacterium]